MSHGQSVVWAHDLEEIVMATRMSLWQLNPDGSATAVMEQKLASEAQIETAIESVPEMLGMDLMIVGRQTMTPSGPLDLLAIDADARLVVIENKRDRTPREVLAQVIDYASWVRTLTFDEVNSIYAKYQVSTGDVADLLEDFEERFGEPLEAIAEIPRMVIFAAHLDNSTERMIDFLADSFAVPVNAVLFQPFVGGFIGRTWLRPEDDRPQVTGKRSASSTATRDQSKSFWDSWLPIGRPVLKDITLPSSGPRSVWLKRSILQGIPAVVQLWVASAVAYAELQFEGDEPAFNAALLAALQTRRSNIEAAFGGPLDWRGPDSHGLMTKRTKVVGPRIQIGDRLSPSEDGMKDLAHSARRLIDAVKPYLSEAHEAALASLSDGG
jgi:hypothetical protein